MKRKTFAILFLAFLVLSSALIINSALAKSKDKGKKPHPCHPDHPEHPITPPPEVPPPHQQPPVGPPVNNTTIINNNNTIITIVTEVTEVTNNNTVVIIQPKEVIVIREEVKEPPRFWIIFIVTGLALLSYGIALAVAPKDSYWHKTVYFKELIDDDTHSFEVTEVFD